VFDLTNLKSLASVKKWYEDVMISHNSSYKPLIFLVGTKSEMLCDSTLAFVETQGKLVAKEIGGEYWPVSAKTGTNVDEFFTRVAVLTFQESIFREMNAMRVERTHNFKNNKFIKLKKNKGCKKYWTFSCVRF
jgi:hypothetical protein